jgi:DNA-binding SARP family transcriptional activator
MLRVIIQGREAPRGREGLLADATAKLRFETGGSPPILICLLGSFRVMRTGEPLAVRSGGKHEAFLSTLALRSTSRIPRETLLETLWPGMSLAPAVQSLNSLVYSLSKLLSHSIGGAAPVLHPNGSYKLNLDAGIGVDILSFDQLAREGAIHSRSGHARAAVTAYEQAIKLYEGDLYAAVDSHAVVERERLRAVYHTSLARLSEHHFGGGDYLVALELSLQLLASDATREDGCRSAMRCYVRCGERAQALRQYRLCERLLRAEFDAKPEPATVALFERIRHDPASV